MKILVNAISARRGGITTYTRNLISVLNQRGQEVEVAASPDFYRSNPDHVFPVAAADMGAAARFAWEQIRWRQIVKARQPDVLFSSANFGLLRSPVPQLLLLREGGLFDPFYIVNLAPSQGLPSAVKRELRRRAMLMSARAADHVITPSGAMREALISWAPDLENKCSVNPYGTVAQFSTAGERVHRWKADGALRLLYVSVYYPHKNPGVLCEAVKRLNSLGLPTHATITMTLSEMDGVKGAVLDRMLLERAHAAKLVTLGYHNYDSLPALYAGHDVFVFPSVSETFGHPMVEAMSSGLPIVAADTRVNREICGDAALYFSPFSVESVAARLQELDADESLRQRLSAIGRERAKRHFKWDDHVDRLIDILRETVERYKLRRA